MVKTEVTLYDFRKDDDGELLLLIPAVHNLESIAKFSDIKGKLIGDDYVLDYMNENVVSHKIIVKGVSIYTKFNLYLKHKVRVVEVDNLETFDYLI
jgi:hypothetical protein